MLKEIFGFRLKKLRTKNKLSQQDLGRLLEVSQTTINHWENNRQEPSLEKLNLISEVFNVDTNYLTGKDITTIKAINHITSENYIYDHGNFLTQKEVEIISSLIKEITSIQNFNFKNKDKKSNTENFIQEMERRDKIMNIILSNEKIKKDIFDIEFEKEIFTWQNATLLEETFCSGYQKMLIEEIIKFNETQCQKLYHYIYHIKKHTRKEEIMSKIIYMNENELNALEANIIGIKEKSNDINNIITKFNTKEE